ncbi:hypothetical protein PMAYCL1PPCAC_33074, partial [Pristionchus mayeri]
GAEHLRVVDRKVAIEVIGDHIGFSPSRVAPGDLIWVYRLRLSHSFAERSLKSCLDLRRFPSKEYLEGVRSGNHPKTVMQVESFAHGTPRTPIIIRLARVHCFPKGIKSMPSSLKVIVEGE